MKLEVSGTATLTGSIEELLKLQSAINAALLKQHESKMVKNFCHSEGVKIALTAVVDGRTRLSGLTIVIDQS